MKTYTLEELEEREVNNLITTKSRNEDNIVKIQNRVNAETDVEEKQRLTNLLNLHSGHKKVLNKIDYKKQASEHLSKIKK